MAIFARAPLLVACALAVSVSAQISFRGSAQMRKEDVTEVLGVELASNGERLANLERELSQMFAGLPKNSEGRVGHQGVRYALHRYFMHSRGWFIRGLEPGGSGWTPQRLPNGELPPAFVKEWVPTFLQNTLEEKLGNRGVALHELAAMAAALEDLIHKEVHQRLEMVFGALDVPVAGPIDRSKADDVLMTYFMTFLLGNNVTAKDKHDIEVKRTRFSKRYAGFAEAKGWYEATVAERLGSSRDAVTFSDVAAVVEDIGAKYHKFNDLECNDLRATLRKMESRRPGRVRLSNFYNMSRFTHWRFIEKEEYLKSLGTLDESTQQPSVIIANYVMGRQNCLEATNLYAICCRNACEDLTAHLEEKLAASSAPAAAIAELVAALPSDTVEAPRALSPLLTERLNEIAAHNGGEVPIHGRLFSQWMHHAYPLECPFPHEAGSINPQTVDEWLRDSGSATESTSEEERQRVVEGDVCAVNWEGKVECSDEETDLPWSLAEELLTGPEDAVREPVASASATPLLLLLAAALLLLAAAGQRRGDSKLCNVAAVLLLATVAYFAGLVNGSAFGFAFVGSFGFWAASKCSAKGRDPGMCLPKTSKFCA